MGSYLIISHSARALAESAKRENCIVHSLDCFADEDTRAVSDSVDQLQFQWEGFDDDELLEKVRSCVNANPSIIIVVGSGFEKKPEQLNQLRKMAQVIGNSTETINKIINPDLFGKVLAKNSILFPGTFLSNPPLTGQYLVKKIGGVGGGHVRRQTDHSEIINPDSYFQEYVAGSVLSAVFLAAEDQVHVIGFNTQLQTNQFPDMPFLYYGAITINSFDKDIQKQILEIVTTISNETGLRGLCGLDFILDENNEIHVLEVNSRPPATFELHENKDSLFKSHLACFDDSSLKVEFNSDECLRGYLILYARQDIHINSEINWPTWVKDRPIQGSTISCQSPVCSVHAEGKLTDDIRELLTERLNKIESTILSMQNAA